MKKASGTVTSFSEKYEHSSNVLNESLNIASETYQKAAGSVAEAGDKFSQGITQTAGSLKNQIDLTGKQVNEIITGAAKQVADDMAGSASSLANGYKDITAQIQADHEAKIKEWELQQSLERTKRLRPDLLNE